MKVHHVLDTGALYLLHDKHKPALWEELSAAGEDTAIVIPALVLSEAGQAKRLEKKKLEKILEIAGVGSIGEDVAQHAAEGLRAVKRDKCEKCSGFRPSIVDAVVMAFADRLIVKDDEAVVHTSDMPDMEALREAFFTRITLRRCS